MVRQTARHRPGRPGSHDDGVAAALDQLRVEVRTLSSLIGEVLNVEVTDSSPQVGALATAPSDCRQAGADAYLSVRQLAERIPYAEQSIRNLMSSGVLREGIHYFKARGRVMFSWTATKAWIEEDHSTTLAALPMVRSRRRGRPD